jgi:endo-1,4-beta-mannosidase
MRSYEVWNEPNAARFWREQATAPADYADLYAATRSAIRAVDPAATVVVGGLVERGARGFVQRFYAHRPDLRGHVDAIGFHVYNATSGAMLRAVAGFRATVDRLDPGVPLAVTEAGFSTTSMSDATRGTELARLASGLAARKALRVSSLLPYAAMTSESAPGSWEQWFGIFNLDGTPKRSATAFLAAVGAAVR